MGDKLHKIFIDGKEGTTGLRIYDRLSGRDDIELLLLSDEDRKKPECRKAMLDAADVAFLCLPDAAAMEAVAMVSNENLRIIDTSTAHRTNPEFAYGFPELSAEYFEKLKTVKRVAVPGCHASGFIALVEPLVSKGIISKDTKLCCHSLTGYSGGGKKMISEYEGEERRLALDSPRQYALGQTHKHLKEMSYITGLENAPIFCPIVADYYSGMLVTVPVFASQLEKGYGIEDIKALYKELYNGDIVRYREAADEDGMYSSNGLSGKDYMEVSAFGNEERIILCARFDNLGKGASGAAVECLNIMLGKPLHTGLDI